MKSSALRIAPAFALAVVGVLIAWRLGRGMAGIDFYQFWAGAQVARQGAPVDLYSAETRRTAAREYLARARQAEHSEAMLIAAQRRPVFEFYSTPYLYATFGLFTGRYDRDYLAYRIVIIAAFSGGVVLMALVAGLSWAKILLSLAFLLSLCEPFASEVRVSNVNSIQFVVFSAAVFMARRDSPWRHALSAAVLGLLVAFKPNVLFVLPALVGYRLVERDFRRLSVEAAGFTGGILAGVLSGALYLRSWQSWVRWAAAARELAGGYLPLSVGNVSPALGLVISLGGAISIAIAAALLGIMVFALRKGRDRSIDETALVASFGLVVYLCAASLVWMHYLVLALPLAIVLMADPFSQTRRWAALLAMTLICYSIWHAVLAIKTMRGQANVFWAGLGLLTAIALHRLMWPTRPPQRGRMVTKAWRTRGTVSPRAG